MIRIYRFNWTRYAGSIMPAFADWLSKGDGSAIGQLYADTRTAREEQFIPDVMVVTRSWPRACVFIQRLPRSPQIQHDYRILCTPELFTALSDRYVQRHAPLLHQHSEALLAIWEALIETYCLAELTSSVPSLEYTQDGRVGLLCESTQDYRDLGVEIGRHPLELHLRGWLATHSLRAMALFELLACGRRYLPFNPRDNVAATYIGYLTPEEVGQLALCLQDVVAPAPLLAREDVIRFRLRADPHRLIDEVLPEHAAEFLQITRQAAEQGYGLICGVEGVEGYETKKPDNEK